MGSSLKALSLGSIEKNWIDKIDERLSEQKISVDWEFAQPPSEPSAMKNAIAQKNLCLAAGDATLKLHKVVHHRTVDSHFLNYIDLVTVENNVLWGHSLFSAVFKQCMLEAIRNQDFKGPVIFLGSNPLALPTLDILARFGFEDFVFLKLDESNNDLSQYEKFIGSLLKTKMSTVNSTAFIRSQKEYSFCFVMEDTYSTQTLEDMSYFHFLSGQSLVFDLSGRSNFLFKEVKALGVDVVEFTQVEKARTEHLCDKITKYANLFS